MSMMADGRRERRFIQDIVNWTLAESFLTDFASIRRIPQEFRGGETQGTSARALLDEREHIAIRTPGDGTRWAAIHYVGCISDIRLGEGPGIPYRPQEVFGVPEQISGMGIISIKLSKWNMWTLQVPKMDAGIFLIIGRYHLHRLPVTRALYDSFAQEGGRHRTFATACGVRN